MVKLNYSLTFEVAKLVFFDLLILFSPNSSGLLLSWTSIFECTHNNQSLRCRGECSPIHYKFTFVARHAQSHEETNAYTRELKWTQRISKVIKRSNFFVIDNWKAQKWISRFGRTRKRIEFIHWISRFSMDIAYPRVSPKIFAAWSGRGGILCKKHTQYFFMGFARRMALAALTQIQITCG